MDLSSKNADYSTLISANKLCGTTQCADKPTCCENRCKEGNPRKDTCDENHNVLGLNKFCELSCDADTTPITEN